MVDYLAAIMLVLGGLLALRGFAERWLSAGWGFACAMFWMSFFGHYRDLIQAGTQVSARDVPDNEKRPAIQPGVFTD